MLITVIQGFGIAVGLESMASPTGAPVVLMAGWAFRLMTIITLTAGTVFLMWLGEQMTERGIGNGISMIIYAGIVAGLPRAVLSTFALVKAGELSPFVLILIVALMLAVLAAIVFMERGQRRIPIQYAKRMVGPEDVRRPDHPLAAAGQYRRRYPAHFRLFDPAFPRDFGRILQCAVAENRGRLF